MENYRLIKHADFLVKPDMNIFVGDNENRKFSLAKLTCVYNSAGFGIIKDVGGMGNLEGLVKAIKSTYTPTRIISNTTTLPLTKCSTLRAASIKV